MKIKKKDLIVIFMLLLLITTYFSISLKNTLIAPVGQLVTNFTEGNFKSNKYLLKRGIDIELKKYRWAYKVKKMDDRIVVHFFGLALNNKSFQNQMADMYILDKNMSNNLFLKLSKVRLEKCGEIIKEKAIKNNYLVNYTLCLYKGEKFVYYDIPSKKIMITYYPFAEDKKGKEKLQEFLNGITIK